MEGNAARSHLAIGLGAKRVGRVDEAQPRRFRAIEPEGAVRVSRIPIQHLETHGFLRVPHRRTAHRGCRFRLGLEAPLFAGSSEVGSVQVPGAFEVVLQLGHPGPVKFEIDIGAPLLDGNAQMTAGHGEATRLLQCAAGQSAMEASLFGKQAHQTLEITQRFQQAAFGICRLSPHPELFNALRVLGFGEVGSRQRTPQQKSTPEEN